MCEQLARSNYVTAEQSDIFSITVNHSGTVNPQLTATKLLYAKYTATQIHC